MGLVRICWWGSGVLYIRVNKVIDSSYTWTI